MWGHAFRCKAATGGLSTSIVRAVFSKNRSYFILIWNSCQRATQGTAVPQSTRWRTQCARHPNHLSISACFPMISFILFEMHFVYILYSPTLNRYYVGETNNIERRFSQHQRGCIKNSYTKRASDWTLYLSITCSTLTHAKKLETYIKRMKSRSFIERLKAEENLVQECIEKFKK